MKVVLDTNVLVSGLLSPNGPPGTIINLILNQVISLLYDDRIIQEYQTVLERPKFNFNKSLTMDFLEFIKWSGERVFANPIAADFKDKDDIPFYEVATTGDADFLVTGNQKHFPKGKTFKVVSPAEFIAEVSRI